MKASTLTSNYVRATDLKPENGGPRLVLIHSVRQEDVGGDVKLVLRGLRPQDQFILNPTNITSITELFGGDDETDNWVLRLLVAYNDPEVTFNNRKVGGIRFRLPKEGAEIPEQYQKAIKAGKNALVATSPASIPDDDVPF